MAKIDPPYRLDPRERIVGVGWGGLAVRFSDGASVGHIDLGNVSTLGSFSKAVISLWFRVPQQSIDAALADIEAYNAALDEGDLSGIKPFLGLIPLISFGPDTVGNYTSSPSGPGDQTAHLTPSVIAVNCFGDDPHIFLKLAYNDNPNPLSPVSDDPDAAPPTGWVTPDYYVVGDLDNPGWEGAGPFSNTPIVVTPDAWHHLLVSFDLSGACSADWSSGGPPSITTTQKVWLAFDDANYTGDSLGPNALASYEWTGGGDNLIFSRNVLTQLVHSDTGDVESTTCSVGNIPIEQFGIPAPSHYASYIHEVELGELQMYTGVTLDTSITANRRAFVSDTGLPVNVEPPVPGTPPPKPGDPPPPPPPFISESLFGKPPELALHGSGQWKLGKNSGSAGNFGPTGTIDRYTPNPKIGR